MTMAEFVEASTLTFVHARRLRLDLEKIGLLEAKVVREVGAMKDYEIRLTPTGREIAKHLTAIESVLERVREPGERETGAAKTRR
jgi:DNA-binding HxlR family transcriptional regulator